MKKVLIIILLLVSIMLLNMGKTAFGVLILVYCIAATLHSLATDNK